MLTPETLAQRTVRRLARQRTAGAGERVVNQISFTEFKRQLFKRYIPADHLNLFDDALTQVARYVETEGQEGIQNLLISMPRRYGKTLTLGRFFPGWYLGRNPDHRIIMTSYGASLVEKTSRLARNVVRSPAYRDIFNLELAQDSKSVSDWNIAGHEGGLDAVGIMGGGTGKGYHIFIGDDLLKNREEAESEIIRDKVWSELQDSFFSGADVPYAARIICATRWHQDDPIGRLLLRQPGRWTYLKLPAIAGEADCLGRAVGQPLWPRKHSLSQLMQIQEDVGPHSWASLWQQEPTPAEGGLFKRIWFDPLLDNCPPIVQSVRYWDLAMSSKTSADYTVGKLLGQAVDGHYYVLDVARKQIDWGELTDWLASVMLADGPEVMQGVEERGYMSRAVQDLNSDPRLHGYSIFGYPADTDKVTRALPFAAKCAAGLVHVLNRHWTQAYIEELCSFPNGVHDDQVDASAGAWAMFDESAAVGAGVVHTNEQYTIVNTY